MADTTVKKIICSSCGAEFEDTLPKCPYCGSLNYKGAEAEYLGKLESMLKIRSRLFLLLKFIKYHMCGNIVIISLNKPFLLLL